MSRPRILDLFCGAGGCAMGYHRAGFDVVGVDKWEQPNYPFEFVQADAIAYCKVHGAEFDAIHASPPCQAHSPLKALHKHIEYPDLLGPTRIAVSKTGVPWVIENVPGSWMKGAVVLCGAMFGLRVYRHRHFWSSFKIVAPPHPKHTVLAGAKGTKGGRGRKAHYLAGGFVTVAGHVGSYCGPAMGIDWMNGKELSQAIPPAYTEFIGKQLLQHLKGNS